MYFLILYIIAVPKHDISVNHLLAQHFVPVLQLHQNNHNKKVFKIVQKMRNYKQKHVFFYMSFMFACDLTCHERTPRELSSLLQNLP